MLTGPCGCVPPDLGPTSFSSYISEPLVRLNGSPLAWALLSWAPSQHPGPRASPALLDLGAVVKIGSAEVRLDASGLRPKHRGQKAPLPPISRTSAPQEPGEGPTGAGSVILC